MPDEVQTPTGASAGDEPTTRSAASARATECFVVMPFGKKPVPAAPESMFDFDKPYRVIMRRAIEAAGMVPVRADESTASGIIHTDMSGASTQRPIRPVRSGAAERHKSCSKHLCGRWESNPHSLRNRDLNPARLPFRHARGVAATA